MTKTILVVDDDEEDIEFLKNGCETEGVDNIVFFYNSIEALDLLLSVEDFLLPSLVVTDFNMPKNGGRELIEYIKSEKRLSGLKTAVISSSLSATEIKNFENLGVDKVFIKPNTLLGYKELCTELRQLAEAN